MCPQGPTHCDRAIEQIDIFKEGAANDRPISHKYLSG